MDIAGLMQPLLPEHLGILALGCGVSDAPARPGAVQRLLMLNFGADFSEETISRVLERIIRQAPELVGKLVTSEASLRPWANSQIAFLQKPVVPAHWGGRCIIDRGLLVRTSMIPTICFTLTSG